MQSKGEQKERVGKVKIDFEILSDQISLEEIKKIESYKKKLKAYASFEILAILKQINQSDEIIKVSDFLTYENLEITNIRKEPREDLITFYDYSLTFDPESYEVVGRNDKTLKPKEYAVDSMNLVDGFKFYLSAPDTFLIRIKKKYFDIEIHSNWDTLIIN